MKRFAGFVVLIVLQLGVAIGWLTYGSAEVTEREGAWVQNLELSPEDRRMQADLARWYNLNLTGSGEGKPLEGYGQILYLEDGLMCRVEFSQGGSTLPVWHGAKEKNDWGLTHLARSAIPVGGKGNHTVLTGGAEILDGMAFPEAGDTFCLQTLGDTMDYHVFDVKTTKQEPNLPQSEAGRDLCSIWLRADGGWVIIQAAREEE